MLKDPEPLASQPLKLYANAVGEANRSRFIGRAQQS
jgi:hypothetical protein